MKTPNVEKLKFAIPRFLTIFIFSADQSLKLTDGLYFIKQDWCIKKKKEFTGGFLKIQHLTQVDPFSYL